jgi:hypothetical protein
MDSKQKDTLVDRYLAAVSEILPAKQREETVTEIRSLIQDALDDRSKAEGGEVDDEMVAEVLKQFGPPEKIVAPYLPEKYLIGPRLFPIFLMVLRIALPIIAILALVGYWTGLHPALPLTGVELTNSILKSLGNTVTIVFQAFGNIVIIFAILQWTLPEFKSITEEKTWDPHSLKALRQPDKIKRGELITEIFFTLVALILFTFYVDKIGIYNNFNGQWSFTPILTSAFYAYIPWLDLLWVLTIILDTILLRRGSWEVGSRIFSIALSLFSIGITASILTNIQYLYTLKGALGELGTEGIFHSALNQALILALAIAIIASAVKIVRMSWQLITSSGKIILPLNRAE